MTASVSGTAPVSAKASVLAKARSLALAYVCAFGCACSLLGLSTPVWAHETFEVDITGGYAFGTRLEASQENVDGELREGDGDFRLDGGFAFSGIFGYRMQPNGFIYLSYTRQQTTADYQATGATGVDLNTSASLEYFQFGGNVEMTRGIFVPYIGVSLGLARLAALGEVGEGSRLFFTPVIDGGVKIDLHRHVHLRFLGRMPAVFTSKELFCITGAGCAVVTKVKPMAQLQLHAGIGVSF